MTDLGTFTIDVKIADNKLDALIGHESGDTEHYEGITLKEAGEIITELIGIVAEGRGITDLK